MIPKLVLFAATVISFGLMSRWVSKCHVYGSPIKGIVTFFQPAHSHSSWDKLINLLNDIFSRKVTYIWMHFVYAFPPHLPINATCSNHPLINVAHILQCQLDIFADTEPQLYHPPIVFRGLMAENDLTSQWHWGG